MSVQVEKKFAVEVVYNGISKSLEVEPEERVTALLQQSIAAFGITQQPHLLSLFREDGTVVPETESVERAGLKPGEVLLLRPNAVKGGGGPLRLAAGILEATFEAFLQCGRGEAECVAYWTGPAGEDLVDRVEHPVHTRWPFGYEVGSDWLTEFWKRLAKARRSVKAQIHTHPGRAFHSETDDRFPIVSQAGFISIVIPKFAAADRSLNGAWVGYLQADGSWRRIACPTEAIVP